MLVEPSYDEDGDDNIEDGLHDAVEHQLVELKDIKEEEELSLNAISGASKPSMMRLKASMGRHQVFLLVDTGLTYNFVSAKIARKLGLKGEVMELFEVKVSKGEKLNYE